MCFGTPNRVSPILPAQCLTGVGYMDADRKVSALKIQISLHLWIETSNFEFEHFLTTKSWIWGFGVFSDWVANRIPVPSTRTQVSTSIDFQGIHRCP